jgi:hypothetical protein
MKVKRINIILIISIVFTVPAVIFTVNGQSGNNFSSKKTYTIGYMRDLFNEVDLSDAQAAVKVWINEIVKTWHYDEGYNLKAKIYNQFEEVIAEMKDDSLAALSLNTFDYLNNNNKLGLEPELVSSAEGDIYGEYYILVRKEDHYRDIKDLKGTNMGVISGTNHIASRLWLDVTLAKYNIPDKKKFFKNFTMDQKESQLILNLFFGHLDACIVSSGAFSLMKELNPQISEKIICIQASPKYLWGLLCFIKSIIGEKDKTLFYSRAMHIQELISGKQLFSLIKIDKVVPFQNYYLNSYRDLMKEYTYLVKIKKIKANESI